MNGNTTTPTHETISKYDKLRGGLKDIALFTKPSTVRTVQDMTGKAETYVIETCRYSDESPEAKNTKKGDMFGDYIFIECIDDNQTVTRVALPPKAADAIASQRDSLTTRRRRLAGKRRAAAMTDEQKQETRDRLAKARGKRKHTTKTKGGK